MKALIDAEQEIWLPVVGYEGLYEVSIFGDIRSLDREELVPKGRHETEWIRKRKGKIRRQVITNSGYWQVLLHKEGIGKQHLVHRLVAYSFLPDPIVEMEVNHKDGNRLNNHFLNLEWVTRSGNSLHSARVLGKNRGESHQKAKLTEDQVREIVTLCNEGFSQTQIAKLFKISNHCVYRIIHGDNWSWLTGIRKEVKHACVD